MVVATTLAVSLVVVTFLFHYAVLRWLSGGKLVDSFVGLMPQPQLEELA